MKDQKAYWERESLSRRRPPTHPVVEAYVRSKLEAIARHVPLTSTTTVLDVGCGNGHFTYHLDHMVQVEGIDASQTMLDLNPVRRTQLMDAAAISYPDDSFDVVLCHAVLHHVADPGQVLQEMRRVSRKYVVIMEPNRNNPLMFLFLLSRREEHSALKFSMAYLTKQAKACGMRILDAFSHGAIVPGATPRFLLGLLKKLDGRFGLGFTNVLIAEKR